MLAGDFFTISAINATENIVSASLELNPAHRIFEGHFPGQPVVPGVCMMQMIKEIFEIAIKKKTRLIRSDYAKFLSMIDPRQNNAISAELKYKESGDRTFEVISTLTNGATVFLKYKAIFLTTE